MQRSCLTAATTAAATVAMVFVLTLDLHSLINVRCSSRVDDAYKRTEVVQFTSRGQINVALMAQMLRLDLLGLELWHLLLALLFSPPLAFLPIPPHDVVYHPTP